MDLSRRDLLKIGAFGSAALALPLERVARTQLALDNRIPASELPAPFTVPVRHAAGAAAGVRGRRDGVLRHRPAAGQGRDPPGPADDDLGLQRHHAGPDDHEQARPAGGRAAGEQPARASTPTLRYNVWTSTHLHGSCSLPRVRRLRQRHHAPGAVQGLPLPEHPGRADALVPRPRRPHHGARTPTWASPRSTSCTTTLELVAADPARPVRRPADPQGRDVPARTAT